MRAVREAQARYRAAIINRPPYIPKLQPPKTEVAFGVAAGPGTDDGAVSGYRVLELAIENKVIHATGLVLGVHFKVNGECRRGRRDRRLRGRCSLGRCATTSRSAQLHIQSSFFYRNSIGAGIDGSLSRSTIPFHDDGEIVPLTCGHSKVSVPGPRQGMSFLGSDRSRRRKNARQKKNQACRFHSSNHLTE